MSEAESSKSNLMRAAAVMLTIGESEAAKLLQHLSQKQIQKLSEAMASLKKVNNDELNSIVGDFIKEANNINQIGATGEDKIRSMLTGALGKAKANNMLEGIDNAEIKGLVELKWKSPEVVVDIIKDEHPQTKALLLSYLEPVQAAQVLSGFSKDERVDLIMRISSLSKVDPMVLKELNLSLEKQIAKGEVVAKKSIGGIKKVADIMNYLDKDIEKQIIEELDNTSEELSENIKDLMFVFDNLKDVGDRCVQALLREISSDTLVFALKGASEEVKNKIFSNMSKRAGEILKDDLEAKGPVKLSDVESSQKEILNVARRMADSGEITLGGKGEEMV